MIEPFLKSQLEQVARRHRGLRRARGLSVCWAVLALLGGVFLLVQRFAGWSPSFALPALGVVGAIATIIVWRRAGQWQPEYRQIARQIEEKFPQLHALLLTAVEQKPDPQSGQYHFLQDRVIREAVNESRKHQCVERLTRWTRRHRAQDSRDTGWPR